MRAAVLYRTGPPDAFSVEEIAPPVAGSGEVLVEVKACGIAYHDVVERNGTYRRDVAFPLVLGYEIAGVVKALGPGVTGLSIGDRVCSKAFSSCGHCRYCRNGLETTCRARKPVRGGYGQYAAIACDALVVFPDSIDFEGACTLGPGAGVALNAVRDTARVTIGDHVLVTGATGGVGLPAVQLAAAAGAQVVAVTRQDAMIERLRAAGAQEVVLWDGQSNFGKELSREGRAVDVVIDTVGSRVFDPAFAALAPHGRYVFVGQLFGEAISINPARIFFKRASLLGVGSVSRTQLEDVIALVEAGRLEPAVASVFPLDRIADAHALVESGGAGGRVVVTP